MPTLDLIVRNANLPDGRSGLDIAVAGGKITEITHSLDAEADREIDATGCLVTPPFVDSHFHLDSTLRLGQPRMNESGTLLEGIRLWSELKSSRSRTAPGSFATGPSPAERWRFAVT